MVYPSAIVSAAPLYGSVSRVADRGSRSEPEVKVFLKKSHRFQVSIESHITLWFGLSAMVAGNGLNCRFARPTARVSPESTILVQERAHPKDQDRPQ